MPGQGTTFWVVLPVAAVPETAPAGPRPGRAPPPIRSRAILLVDDEPSIVKALTRLLRRDGHTVDTASNGRLALARLQERTYDVILSDLRMPELDGPGLYRALAGPLSASVPALHSPYRGYPEPRGPRFFCPERCGPADQTLHRGGSPTRHSAGHAGQVSALLQSEFRHTTLSARAEGTAICSRRHSGYIAHHNQPSQTLSPFPP